VKKKKNSSSGADAVVEGRDLRASAGFTLLELLLAVALFAILASIVYGVLVKTLEAKEVAEQRAELFAMGRETVLRMGDEIEGALLPRSGDRIYFQAPTSHSLLEFIRMNRGGYGIGRVRAGQVLVAYGIGEKDPVTGFPPLVREEYHYRTLLDETDGVSFQEPESQFDLDEEEPEDDAPPQMRINLLECPPLSLELNLPGSCVRLSGLRFRYYDDAIQDWRESWDSFEEDGPTQDRLPAAVEIALGILDERGVEHLFTTIVDVPMARANPDPENLDEDLEEQDAEPET
jgi:prepilin-type N-terminal cleavage/methylation domain-containing protein